MVRFLDSLGYVSKNASNFNKGLRGQFSIWGLANFGYEEDYWESWVLDRLSVDEYGDLEWEVLNED